LYKEADEDKENSVEFDKIAPVIRILMTEYLPSFKKMHPKLIPKVLEDFFAWMDINK
jgi:hypothetical protein